MSPSPTILLENFEGTRLQLSTGIQHIQGANLSFDCDVVSTDRAVVFNKDGPRELVTGELNTTNSMYVLQLAVLFTLHIYNLPLDSSSKNKNLVLKPNCVLLFC